MENNNDFIPIEKVVDDMYSDKTIISGIVKDYYKKEYADENELKIIELEDKVSNIFTTIFSITVPIMIIILIILSHILN